MAVVLVGGEGSDTFRSSLFSGHIADTLLEFDASTSGSAENGSSSPWYEIERRTGAD